MMDSLQTMAGLLTILVITIFFNLHLSADQKSLSTYHTKLFARWIAIGSPVRN